MVRTPVKSSNVVSAGYQDGTMEIEFKSGTYQFPNFPKEMFDNMMAASSIGQFFGTNIRGLFKFSKV